MFPCNICKKHFIQNRHKIPFEYFEKDGFKWTFLLHDEVNKAANKISPPIDIMFNYYDSLYFKRIIDAMFHTVFTFILVANHQIMIDFFNYIANMSDDHMKLIIIQSLKLHFDQRREVFDWVYFMYLDICNFYNLSCRNKLELKIFFSC